MSSDEQEIHPSHMPELAGKGLYPGGRACMKCMHFVEYSSGLITRKGAAPCKPLKVTLRGFKLFELS